MGLTDRLLWDSPVGWLAAKVMPHSHAGVHADVAGLLAVRADDDLLDIGCGPGAFLAEWITTGTARLVLAEAHELPSDDGSSSEVTVITAPMNLAEVHRVLRPGGRLVVVDELTADPRKSSPERTEPRNEADTLALIEQAGFADPVVRYRGVWHLVDNRIIGCTKADTS